MRYLTGTCSDSISAGLVAAACAENFGAAVLHERNTSGNSADARMRAVCMRGLAAGRSTHCVILRMQTCKQVHHEGKPRAAAEKLGSTAAAGLNCALFVAMATGLGGCISPQHQAFLAGLCAQHTVGAERRS